jgi:hypothetical protein
MKLKNFKFRDVTRRVPELPHGCYARDVQEMESYFIFQRKVVYDPETCPHGCNSRIGDHAAKMTPTRFSELKEMFAPDGTGYEFPTTEPKELMDARAEMEMAGEYLEMAKEVGDKQAIEMLEECTTLATCEFYNLEASNLGLRALVECTLTRYEGKFFDSVNVKVLQSELNGIKVNMGERQEFSDLQRIISSMSLVCKEKEGVDVTSEAAVHVLKLVLAMITPREEAALKWTNKHVERKMKAVRTWTKSNGLRKPVQCAKDAAEKSMGAFLKDWKLSNAIYGGSCTDLTSCKLVMRDVKWFEEFVASGRTRMCAEWKKLNRQLLDGFAWHAEPEFEGKKAISAGKGNIGVYQKLNNLFRGQGREELVAIALTGLPMLRSSYYQTAWAAARQRALRAKNEYSTSHKRTREDADPNRDEFAQEAEEEEAEEEEAEDEEELFAR